VKINKLFINDFAEVDEQPIYFSKN